MSTIAISAAINVGTQYVIAAFNTASTRHKESNLAVDLFSMKWNLFFHIGVKKQSIFANNTRILSMKN